MGQKVIWDQDQMDQWELLQAIWDQDQMDQWDLLQAIWVQVQTDQWALLQVIWDQVVLIHYLVKQDQQVDHLQEICLQVIRWVNQDQWTADRVIQWDLHLM